MRRALLLVVAAFVACGGSGPVKTSRPLPIADNDGGSPFFPYLTRATPFVAQPATGFDPKPRFVFGLADVDGNGTRDDVMFDRISGAFSARLFGAFKSNHAYGAVDQAACTKLAWANVNTYVPGTPQPNLDYCNAVVRPEEVWATVHLRSPVDDPVRLLHGYLTTSDHEIIALWDGGVIWALQPDTLIDDRKSRPGITQVYWSPVDEVAIERIDVCTIPGLPESEQPTCAGDRWRNLARPWENVLIADITGDGLDDIIGMVNIDDNDPNSQVGIWALTDGWRVVPKLLGIVDAGVRGAKLAVQNGVVAITSQSVIDVATGKSRVDFPVPYAIDDVVALGDALAFRAKAKSDPHSHYWVFEGSLSEWKCPWRPSPLDTFAANRACLGDGPLADPATQTVILTPDACNGDCVSLIQSHLDNPGVRNVVLGAGDWALNDTITVSSLDPNGQHQAIPKRLIGQGARLVASNRYYALNGSTVTDIAPTDEAAELARFDKCRAYRDYDAHGDYDSDLPPQTATSFYRYLRTECPVVQTLGSNVTVSDLTIDTSVLAAITNVKGGAVPQFVSIDVGYYANGWAWPFDDKGKPNTGKPWRVIDSSRPPDENIQISRIVLDQISAAGIQTEPSPMPVRDLVVEDLKCVRAPNLNNQANCIEVDAPPVITWPYDDAYRPTPVPFSPGQTTNMIVRKGPDDDSYCDLGGNSQTVRVSGVIGFVLQSCLVRKGLSDGIFLYVTDTGAKLDATLVDDAVYLDPTADPHFVYDPALPTRDNDALITISGRPMSRNSPFNNRLDVPAGDPQLSTNRALDEAQLYYLSKYLHHATPSQVLIQGLTSQVGAGSDTDAQHRVHIKEELGTTGKVMVDGRFFGGGQVFSADSEDLWANTITCPNPRVVDWSTATADQKGCVATYTRELIAGKIENFGYRADGTPITLPDPFAPIGTVHGSWFEISGSATNVAQPDAIRILPGRGDPLMTAPVANGRVSISVTNDPAPEPTVVLPPLPE
jgi:hypothetical protein